MKTRRGARAVLAGLTASVTILASASPALADEVADGQYVPVNDYVCGATEVATGATMGIGNDIFRQRALVYRHCGTGSVKRKADIIAGPDGTCYSIPAGKARVLSELFVITGRDTYREAKTC